MPEQGAGLGAEHLLSLGHQRLRCSPAGKFCLCPGSLAGWKTTLAQAGVEAFARWRRATGARLQVTKGHQLLAGAQLPEPILVMANDQMALGVLRACAEKGVAVPGQISVVGFDDTADSAWFSLRSPPFGRRSAGR
ncbi:MAG: substrate-binding domain-containing protein [Enterobacter hormaechei]